jgi:hypothetical protein
MFDLDSYLAGIFDGEGCISAQFKSGYRGRKSPYSRLLLSVGMIDVSVPKMFRLRFGGSVKRYENSRGYRAVYQWYAGGATAIPALEVFSDLLLLKRDQAVLALELARLMGQAKARGKRPEGSLILSQGEIDRRIYLAAKISSLKKTIQHADA